MCACMLSRVQLCVHTCEHTWINMCLQADSLPSNMCLQADSNMNLQADSLPSGPSSKLPRYTCCCCCCITLVMSNSVQPHRWQPPRLPRPWDSHRSYLFIHSATQHLLILAFSTFTFKIIIDGYPLFAILFIVLVLFL